MYILSTIADRGKCARAQSWNRGSRGTEFKNAMRPLNTQRHDHVNQWLRPGAQFKTARVAGGPPSSKTLRAAVDRAIVDPHGDCAITLIDQAELLQTLGATWSG